MVDVEAKQEIFVLSRVGEQDILLWVRAYRTNL